MSDIDFEALGKYLWCKERVDELIKKRDSLFDSIQAYYTRTTQQGTVRYIDTGTLKIRADALDKVNTDLFTAVDEHNHWARKTERPEIKVLRDILTSY
ncbi:hypothetical protein D6J84_14525 [Salmonella enterica subsp. enterica]|nr:hypothetical protein [Salmonella enterica subsp. enterica serovar Javiana]